MPRGSVGDSPAMVPDKVERIWCDVVLGNEAFRWLPVVRELQKMQHAWVFLSLHSSPRFFRDILETATNCSIKG